MEGGIQKGDEDWDTASLATTSQEEKGRVATQDARAKRDDLSSGSQRAKLNTPRQNRVEVQEKKEENLTGSPRSQKSKTGSPRSQNSRPDSPKKLADLRKKEMISLPNSPFPSSSRPGSPRPEATARKGELSPASPQDRVREAKPIPLSPEDNQLNQQGIAVDPNKSYEITPEMNERWDTKSIVESGSISSKTGKDIDYGELGEPPNDACRMVWLIAALHGIGVLIPWNMFITIAPNYYVDYWFTSDGVKTEYAKSFMSALGITSQIPNFLMSVLNAAQIIGGTLMIRIVGTLTVNCITVAIIIVLAVSQDPSPEAMEWFFYVSLIIVIVMNASNGLYQNSVYGLMADFPANYTNAIIVGNNICGTFISILAIVTTIAFITDSKTVAIVYFSISLVVLIACVLSLYCLTQIEFFKYYVYKGKLTRQVEHASRPSLEQFMQTIKGCWAQLVSVFLVFFVTLAVFPTILAGITPNNKGQKWSSQVPVPREIYYGITVFLNFNLLAAIGSTTANFIQIPGPNLLLVPVSARLLFIPFFMLCNYNVDDRVMPVYFENEWYFIIGNAIMAFTSGYFSSLAMMYAPRVVPGSLSKTAGMIAALFLVTGIVCGVAFVPAITHMVNNINF